MDEFAGGATFENVRQFLYHVFYGRQATAEADEAMYNEKKKVYSAFTK